MSTKWMLMLGMMSVVAAMVCAEPPPHAEPDYNARYLNDQLAPAKTPGKVFYVARKGKPDATGAKEDPFGSLESARDAIRALKKSEGLPKGGVGVVILPGTYHFSTTFKLSEEDAGTREAPIVYRGVSAEQVTFTGGTPISTKKMGAVRDRALFRLRPKARKHVRVVDVPKRARGCFPGEGKYGMISLDGHLLTLAQWPNRGYNHIDTILDKGPSTRMLPPGEKPAAYSRENPTGGKFTFREPLHEMIQKEFKLSGDMEAQGYFHNDWFFQREQVGAFDDDVVQLLRYTRYGIIDKIGSLPRRIRLVNVMCELDEPGEWYYDKKSGKLYIWPPFEIRPGRSRLIALGEDGPLLEMRNTSYVTFQGISFENTGKLGISLSGGEHNLIAGCAVRNGLYRGATVSGGLHNGITGCEFRDLEAAFSISGGNARTLERCYNFATNNDIHSCRRRGYGMVGLSGVGIFFAHNVLHDMNGAVSFNTIDSLLEYNEFYNIGYEMGDFNVAYCGAQWHMMNNVLRYNFVHHLLEPGGHPVCGFRNDDGGAGMQLYGNVFYRPGRGAAQFAGPLNSFQNNITMDCNIVWWTNKRSIDEEAIAASWKDLEKFGRDLPQGDKGDNIYIMEKVLGEKGWTRSPWIDEFPMLAKMLELNPFAQTYSMVTHNYMNGVREPFHIHGGGGDIEGMEDDSVGRFVDLPREGEFVLPLEIPMDAFADVSTLNFNFKPDFQVMDGFKPIPFDSVGFVSDRFRPIPPDKTEYRAAVYRKFKSDRGGRYDANKVNARYPTPSYLE